MLGFVKVILGWHECIFLIFFGFLRYMLMVLQRRAEWESATHVCKRIVSMVILIKSTTNNVSWFAVFEAVVDEIREKSRNFVIWISQNFDDFLWFFFKSSALAVQIWLCINSKQDWLMSSMPTKWHDQIPTFRPIAVSPDLPVIWSEHTAVLFLNEIKSLLFWRLSKLKTIMLFDGRPLFCPEGWAIKKKV